MRDDALRDVREQLLRAGIAPRHVRRYIMELRDHLADLVARERAAGHAGPAAASRAQQMLGTDAQLVQAMIDSGAPRSLAARAPWAVFGILPVVTLLIVVALLHSWSMALFFPYRELSGISVPESLRTLATVLTLLGSYCIGPVLALACSVVAVRQRLSSAWVWIGLALIALASGAIGVQIQFLAPEGGMPGGIRGSALLQVYQHGQVDFAATRAWIAARVAVLFVLSAVTYSVLRNRAGSRLLHGTSS